VCKISQNWQKHATSLSQARNNCCFFVFFALLVLPFFLFFSKASTQTNDQIQLIVSPEMFELHLKKGEVYENKIKIYNKGENPMPLRAIAANFGAEDYTGTTIFYNNPKSENSEETDLSINPQRWIKIKNPNFILDSKETVKVDFTVSVPENVENGGYYAVIFLEPMTGSDSHSEGDKSGLKILPKIGILFLITIGERDPSFDGKLITVAQFSIPEKYHLKKLENSLTGLIGLFQVAKADKKNLFSIVETGRLQFDLIIKNNDVYHNKPYGKLAILSSDGKMIGETEIRKTTILPGKSREIPVEFNPEIPEFAKKLPAPLSSFISKNLLFGKFYAELTLNVEDKMTTEKIEFWIFPWKTAIWIFIILAAILILRKRIVMAMKVVLLNPKSKSQ